MRTISIMFVAGLACAVHGRRGQIRNETMQDGSYEEHRNPHTADNTTPSSPSLAELEQSQSNARAEAPKALKVLTALLLGLSNPAAGFAPAAHLRPVNRHVPAVAFAPPSRKPALQAQDNFQEGKQDWNFSSQQEFVPQAFPPATIYGIDMKTLLHTWGRKVREDEEAWRLRYRQVTEKKERDGFPTVRGLAPPHAFLVDCMLSIMEKMEGDITALQDSDVAGLMFRSGERGQDGILEAVGLLSNDPRQSELDATHDVSLKALAVFSRGQLECNSKSASTSLKSTFESQFGIEASDQFFSGGDKKSVPVWEIEGLVDTELTGKPVRLLLTKIAKWAQIEQKLVMVAQNAVHLKDGSDLTGYYMRLGFAKVNMDDESSRLIYPGSLTSDTDQWVVGRQFMVLLDPWEACGELQVFGDVLDFRGPDQTRDRKVREEMIDTDSNE